MSVPAYTQPEQYQPQPRRTSRKFWIIIVALIIVACAVAVASVGVTAYSALNSVKQNGPIPARYYLNILGGSYEQAYTYLDSSATIDGQPVDQQTFIRLAKAADAQYGTVHGFALNANNDAAHITVTVERGSRSYDVHLVLRQENGTWKIISADGI